ncbi:MAG TPA: hypothetical protein VNT77_03885 [Allosphingosinicella sp.]|nr:hypothetical protein [Allosphingosinicella sp.]
MAAGTSACATQPPAGDSGPCPVGNAGGWRAWVDLMPGSEKKLWVAGNVTAPTGGWRLSLERGPVQEIDPPVQIIYVRAEPPSGGATQALVKHELHGNFPPLARYGAVTIRCGSETLADINRVEEAH